MANNYLQFSEVVPHLTDKEIDWLKEQLQRIYVFQGRQYSEDELPAQLNPDSADWAGCRAYLDMLEYDAEFDEGAGFEYQFQLKPDPGWGRHLWLYAEESGYVSRVAHLVQKFLRMFRPKDCWSLTYALTCSKPRVGEFGGGAVFVTAAEIKWESTDDFVEGQRELFTVGHTPASGGEHDQPQ
jgi:hypothetical protein